MTGQEYAEIYDELADILRTSGLSRIVDYVEGVLDEEVEDKKYQPEGDNHEDEGDEDLEDITVRQLDLGVFPGMILLNPHQQQTQSIYEQKLRLLIQAFERAFIHPMEMADELTSFFSEHANIDTLRFLPENKKRGKTFELRREDIQAHMPLIYQVKKLLSQLPEEEEHASVETKAPK